MAASYYARLMKRSQPATWWRLGEDGTLDASGNSIEAIPVAVDNADSLLAGDPADGAYDIANDAAHQLYNPGDNAALKGLVDDTGKLSLNVWTRHRTHTNALPAALVDIGSGGLPIYVQNLAGTARAYVGGTNLDVAGAYVLNDTAMWTVTYDLAKIRLYKNGAKIGELAAALGPWAWHAANSAYFIVNWGITAADGITDEPAVWGRDLDPVEIADLYRAGARGEPQITRVQEPHTLSASIDLRDGNVLHASPEAASTFDTPLDIGFETQLPGGFGPGEIVLPRPADFDIFDVGRGLYGRTRIYDEADRTVHQGRIVGTPHVGVNEVELQLEGPAAALEDNETARALIVDRDLSNWGGPSRQLKLTYQPSGYEVGEGSVTPDPTTGVPSITQPTGVGDSSAPWVLNAYDAKGLGIGRLYYAWTLLNLSLGLGANFRAGATLAENADLTGAAQQQNVGAGSGSGVLIASGAKKTFAFLDWVYTAISSGWGPQNAANWSRVAVHGDHQLPVRGADPGGYYVSDIVPWLVGKFAKQLNVDPGLIEQTSFPVPHFVYLEDTTAKEMLEALMLFGGNTSYPLDWGVYDDWTFFMRSPGNYGTKWRSRRDEGNEPRAAGPDAQERINGVKVSFNDGSENVSSVGPPDSGAKLEVPGLLDLDPTNPANRDGGQHWKHYEAGILNPPGATLIAQMILAEKNRQEWRGDIDLKGDQVDEANNSAPVYMVRAGDADAIEDDGDTKYRRITGTSYGHKDRSTRATIGADPDRFDVLLAKAGVVTADL